jgi:hypothetical protein
MLLLKVTDNFTTTATATVTATTTATVTTTTTTTATATARVIYREVSLIPYLGNNLRKLRT